MKNNKKSENSLRQRLIKALEKIDDIKNIEDIHGQYEYGIDITFNIEDVFGLKQKCGIQIKNGDIDAPKIQRIFGQLSVAYGHKQFLDAVYIITDGKLKGAAKEHFNNARIGFRNVFLIEGDKLIQFLNKYEQQLEFIKES